MAWLEVRFIAPSQNTLGRTVTDITGKNISHIIDVGNIETACCQPKWPMASSESQPNLIELPTVT